MVESAKAVFLSYASQDAEAAWQAGQRLGFDAAVSEASVPAAK